MAGILDNVCQTWPRFGTLVNGRLYQQAPLEHRTGGIESGSCAGMSWLTPSANEDAAGTVNGKMQTMLSHQVQGRFNGQPCPATGQADLASRSTDGSRRELWGTPRSQMGGNTTDTGKSRLEEQALAGGKLNPHWVYCLMGYPPLWAEIGRKFTTGLRNSKRQETQSCQK
jgi:hypothetical protein